MNPDNNTGTQQTGVSQTQAQAQGQTHTPTPGQGGQTPQASTPGAGGRTFTQEELDRIIGERLARAEAQWSQKAEEDRKKAQMTESEKLKAEKEAAEKKAADTLAQANERLVKAETKVVSVELGIVDSDVAYLAMDRTGVKVDDKTGKVEGIKPALEALLKDKPYLKGNAASTSVGSTGGNPGPSGATDPVEAMKKIAEERNKHVTTTVGGYDPWASRWEV